MFSHIEVYVSIHIYNLYPYIFINFDIFTSQPPATTLQIFDKLMQFYILLHSNDNSKSVGLHSVNCNYTAFLPYLENFCNYALMMVYH